MTLQEALSWATNRLLEIKMDSATLDAEVILSFVLKKERGWLLAHEERKLSVRQIKKFQDLIGRRVRHEPVAYLTGRKEFYGLDFIVNKNVLIPRPETELMIDYLKETLTFTPHPSPLPQGERERAMIVDVGTGSGCLAVTAAKVWPGAPVVAIDNSAAALKVARANARRHGVGKQIKFLKGDLLHPLYKGHPCVQGCPLYLLANLPYLSTAHWRKAPLEVRHYEPPSALLAGRDGLKYYRKLIKQLASTRVPLAVQGAPLLTVLLEIDPHQTMALQGLIKKTLPGAIVEIRKDLAGLERLVVIITR